MVHLKQNIHRVVSKVSSVVGRKKTDDGDISLEGPQLPRVLGFADLTLLGVGSTLGVGVYVLAGTVAKSDAGPAVTLSFLVAAIASALAGICYAEFAARVPKAGSAYVYSYVTVGELAAFVIGWNLILEYVIGTASVARAFSAYLDQMSGKVIANALTEAMPLHVDFLSPYPDFLSLGIVLILTALLAYGVRESAYMNNIFTAFNLLTVVTVIVAGLFQVDSYNWSIPKDKIPEGVKGGEGGFLPFGVSGVMAGAAKCFFGFVGFDCVATTGEEAKNPQRHIPLAIVTSLVIIFASYFGISLVLTMMIPYYAQDADAPLVKAFEDTGMHVISMIVSAGAVFALCTSLLGSMFPMPRMFYSMAKDGLLYRKLATINATTETAIFATILSGFLSGCMLPAPRLLYSMGKDKTLWKFLATISDRSRTPLKATLVAGGISGIMAALFNLEQLIDMMSIGTLLAYTVVALCVLLLRYRDSKPPLYEPNTPENEAISWTQSITNLINYSGISHPDKTTTNVAEVSTGLFVAMTFITTLVISCTEESLSQGDMTPLYAIVVLLILTCLPVIVIAFQPQENPPVFFKVPLLPVLPCISIFINVYLMMKLDLHTWIRFGAWLVIGGVIYVFYSIPNSVEGQKDKLAKQNEKLRM